MSEHDRRLERYITGDMTSAERTSFEDEILADPALVDRVYDDANLLVALDTAARARRHQSLHPAESRAWWRRPLSHWLPPLAAAAAALAVVLIMSPLSPPIGPAPVYRGGTASSDSLQPRGTVDTRPSRFLWSPIDGASQYRVELYDETATRVFLSVTTSTEIEIDAAIAPSVGYWVLTPLDDIGVTIGDAVVTHYRTVE